MINPQRTKVSNPMRALLTGSAVGVLIKGSAAALSLAMFTALARVTDTESFGLVGFCFSLATVLAVAGSLGQRMMSLRDAAVAHDKFDPPKLALICTSGGLIVCFGTMVCALLLLPFQSLGLLGLEGLTFFAMAGLAVTLALAEHMVHFFRGYRSIAFALIPRDIVWRGLVILGCLLSLGLTWTISASALLWLLSAALLLPICLQMLRDPNLRHRAAPAPLIAECRTRLRTGLPFWGTSLVQTISGPVLAPVILGLALSPNAVGPFFAAFRIALILELFTMAAGLVVAPLVAKAHASGHRADLHAPLRHAVLLVSAATLACFLIIALFGDRLLALMNPDFASAAPALTILGCGFVVSVLCGPVPTIMELAGQERLLLRHLVWLNGACLIVLVPATLVHGMIGAAICVAGLRVATHIVLLVSVRRQLGIDPSILSILRRPA